MIQEMQETPVIAKLVANNERLDFLPNIFGDIIIGIGFEGKSFDFAKSFSNDYKGGYWEYHYLSENTGFMSLPKKEIFSAINTMNYSEAEFNGFEYGIICSLFSLNYLMQNDRISQATLSRLLQNYDSIMDYVAQLEDNSRIYQFID